MAKYKNNPSNGRTENSLQIAFKTQMKLIYRPSAIKNVDFAEEKKLTWSKTGNMITVKPNTVFMNFQSITLTVKGE